MKKIIIVIVGLLFTQLTYGQIITIKAGTSFSKLEWKLDKINLDPPYKETLIGLSIFAGIDYLNKKYYNLSSSIGYIQRGGRGEIPLTNSQGNLTDSTITSKPGLNYFSFNTIIELKYPIKKNFIPFLCIGPRLDFLTSYSDHFDSIDDINELNNISYGLLIGGGIKYEFTKFQIGLRCDYYLDFDKVADWPQGTGVSGGEITTNTITTEVSFAYRLK